jgi:hypothetical protein
VLLFTSVLHDNHASCFVPLQLPPSTSKKHAQWDEDENDDADDPIKS